jgi:hypothetical protein
LGESGHSTADGRAPHPVTGVILPIMLLLVVVALVSGLVAGGVLQGDAERAGVDSSTTTVPTILIEP